MNIKELLEHSWIQKYNKSSMPDIRRKSKELKYSSFKLYSTIDDKLDK
jgi:hypothetical protein